jgi:hypothetical protein
MRRFGLPLLMILALYLQRLSRLFRNLAAGLLQKER